MRVLWRRMHCILFCVSHIRCSSSLKVISSYYATLPSNHIGYVCKYVPSFVQMTRRQMREIGERNRFCSPTSSFYFDPPGTDHFSLGLFEKLLFFYNHKNKETTPRHSRICVTCKLEKQSLRGASCTGNCLY